MALSRRYEILPEADFLTKKVKGLFHSLRKNKKATNYPRVLLRRGNVVMWSDAAKSA